MLACVCRPVTSSLPKPPASSMPQKRQPLQPPPSSSMVVTCEPRIASATLLKNKKVPGRPNTAELRAMALRQQQQIDTQHQLLAAKEQRLRFLKNQEIRSAAAAAEGERLRRLRERVEAQESKLRRLRALRGQVDLQKTYNVTLSNDLDSIRALFSEKEKELSLAVAKVEALTKQLEELRRDRRGPLNLIPASGGGGGVATTNSNLIGPNVGSGNGTTNNHSQQHQSNSNSSSSTAARELDKLRRELMYRNQLSLQQDARLHLQREALHQRQAELRSVDQRIYELQSRLQKKKASNLSQFQNQQPKSNQLHLLNQIHHQQQQQQQQQQQPQFNHQNSENINYTNNNGVVLQFVNNNGNSSTAASIKPSHSVYPSQRIIPKGNVAAVEPYIHTPQQQKPNAAAANKQQQQHQQNMHHQQQKLIQDLTNMKLNLHETNNQNTNNNNNNNNSNSNINAHHIQFVAESDETKLARQMLHMKQHSHDLDIKTTTTTTTTTTTNDVSDFAANKADSKYQTLPYTTNKTTALSKNIVANNSTTIHNRAATVNAASTLKHNVNDCDSTKAEFEAESLNAANGIKSQVSNSQQLTVHSTPLNAINKSVAVPMPNASGAYSNPANTANQSSDEKSNLKSKLATAHHHHNLHQHHQIPSGNLVVPPRKPISSVAPTSITLGPKSVVPSPRVHVVAPSINTVPILSTTEVDKSRPALPPKPNKNSGEGNETSPSSNASSTSNGSNANKNRISNVSSSSLSTTVPTVIGASDKSIITEANQQQSAVVHTTLTNAPNIDNFPIKAKPLTIKKQPLSEQPRLRSLTSGIKPIQYSSRRIEMPPAFLFPEIEKANLKLDGGKIATTTTTTVVSMANVVDNNNSKMPSPGGSSSNDETDKSTNSSISCDDKTVSDSVDVVRRQRSSMSDNTKVKLTRRVSFDPLALLLDASLEGELELVQKTAMQVPNPSAANDEGITALHNAICAGHFDIVKFLVEFGCDVNAQDSDGWTPLHCAASCNNLAMVKFLVESGACLFASTLSDHETPAEKCEEDEEGFDGCSEYLYSIQEKLGIMNNGEVFAVFSYTSQQSDELSFEVNDQLTILRKGDDAEREWWWAKMQETGKEGYVPRNLLGLYARIPLQQPSE